MNKQTDTTGALDRAIAKGQDNANSLIERLRTVTAERDQLIADTEAAEIARKEAENALVTAQAGVELGEASAEDVSAAQAHFDELETTAADLPAKRQRIAVLNAMCEKLTDNHRSAAEHLQRLQDDRREAQLEAVGNLAKAANQKHIELTEAAEAAAVEVMACAAVLADQKFALQGCEDARRYFNSTIRGDRPHRIFQNKQRIADEIGLA
ncbi:hypothetical protein [Denitromonas ohlonensis]|uniref:PspA/IM30 family protein n=2 Tax=Denitromonas TaxID=139331 RepID=A0A557RLB7_9RHOO|nr:hypothetical protein [Denitromonas ohlonensis]TVO65938.1 hypothetical protein FHP90_10730 [Denitromonas ohlonensis]TVO79531.1 hypothetical protein FHP89_01915 [Denitromonas ohlonensis]